MQIVQKFLATGAVGKLLNNTYFTGRNAADSADINILKVNASDRIEFASAPQTSSAPATGNDLVNKTYADGLTGSGASTSLNNIASTAASADIKPGTDVTYNLGSASFRWTSGFIGNLKDSGGFICVDLTNRQLQSTTGATMLSWSVGTRLDASVLIAPNATGTLDLGSSTRLWKDIYATNFKDSSSVISINLASRLLVNSSGTTMLDFSGTDISVNTRKITNLVDPGSAQDAATKAYVDSVISAQKTWGYEALTLSGTDITNQYKDLAQVAITGSIFFYVNGVWQRPTTDYTISYTGGAGGKTRLTFAGDLATAGAAALIAADVIHIMYQY